MKISIIKSKKFILRPFQKGDEKSLAKNVNNRKINEMVSLIPYPYSLKDAKKWIEFNLNEYKKESHYILISLSISMGRWQDRLVFVL